MAQYHVVLSLVAIEQINTAVNYFDSQRSGLGFEFTLEVALLVERLELSPNIYQVVNNDIRRGFLGKFNYLAFYKIKGTDVEIIRIEHGSRKSLF